MKFRFSPSAVKERLFARTCNFREFFFQDFFRREGKGITVDRLVHEQFKAEESRLLPALFVEPECFDGNSFARAFSSDNQITGKTQGFEKIALSRGISAIECGDRQNSGPVFPDSRNTLRVLPFAGSNHGELRPVAEGHPVFDGKPDDQGTSTSF